MTHFQHSGHEKQKMEKTVKSKATLSNWAEIGKRVTKRRENENQTGENRKNVRILSHFQHGHNSRNKKKLFRGHADNVGQQAIRYRTLENSGLPESGVILRSYSPCSVPGRKVFMNSWIETFTQDLGLAYSSWKPNVVTWNKCWHNPAGW